jgi:type I restriction enzyme R subunit
VKRLNERFGTDLTEVDELLLDQSEESWVADGELADQARNNSIENFGLVFERKLLQTIVTRVNANDQIYKKILDDEDFRATVGEFDRTQEVGGSSPPSSTGPVFGSDSRKSVAL